MTEMRLHEGLLPIEATMTLAFSDNEPTDPLTLCVGLDPLEGCFRISLTDVVEEFMMNEWMDSDEFICPQHIDDAEKLRDSLQKLSERIDDLIKQSQ